MVQNLFYTLDFTATIKMQSVQSKKIQRRQLYCTKNENWQIFYLQSYQDWYKDNLHKTIPPGRQKTLKSVLANTNLFDITIVGVGMDSRGANARHVLDVQPKYLVREFIQK